MARAGLTPDRVVVAAERLVDEVGPGAFTLAGLARRRGVRQPSLDKHVGGLDDVRRQISVRARRELARVLGRAAGGFGMARDVDRSFDALGGSLIRGLGRTRRSSTGPAAEAVTRLPPGDAVVDARTVREPTTAARDPNRSGHLGRIG